MFSAVSHRSAPRLSLSYPFKITTGKTSLLYTFAWIYIYLSSSSLSQVVSIAVGDDIIQKIQGLHQKMFLQIYYLEIRNAYVRFEAFMKNFAQFIAFWDLKHRRLKYFFQPFGETCCIHVQIGQILCRKIPKWMEKEMCLLYRVYTKEWCGFKSY